MNSLKMLFTLLLLSTSAWAYPLDPRAIQVEARLYGETGCNYYYGTKADFRVSVDLSSLESLDIEFVSLTYGFQGAWTKDFELNVNPQRADLSRQAGSQVYSFTKESVDVVRRRHFKHEALDFLFSAQLKSGEVIDLDGGGVANVFTAPIRYELADCASTEWDQLPVQILRPRRY